ALEAKWLRPERRQVPVRAPEPADEEDDGDDGRDQRQAGDETLAQVGRVEIVLRDEVTLVELVRGERRNGADRVEESDRDQRALSPLRPSGERLVRRRFHRAGS